MGALSFVGGSAAGAALAWLVGRRDRRRSAIAALIGVSCGLLGVVVAMSDGTATTMTDICVGLLGTVAPLSLCVTPVGPTATNAELLAAVRRFSATLLLALVYGIGCATIGFVAVFAVRHISCKLGEPNNPGRSSSEMTHCS